MDRDELLNKESERLLNSQASSLAGIYSMMLLTVLIAYNWYIGAPKNSLTGILFVYIGIYYFLNTSKEQKLLRITFILMIIAGSIFFMDPLIKSILC